MKICVFCSANEQIDPDFFRMTEELGHWAARQGHTIVFGGNDSGLMHAVSKSAKESGGHVVGVVPRVIEQKGKLSPYLDEHFPTETLSERKELMMAQADVFIVLPGGIGTLDEVFTVASARSLGFHHKRLVLYNMKGFWDSLIAMMDDLQSKGMMRGQWRESIGVAENIDDIKQILILTASG
jgi:hypothetical protein